MCVTAPVAALIGASTKATAKVAPVLEKVGGKKFAYDAATGKPTMENAKALAGAADGFPRMLAAGWGFNELEKLMGPAQQEGVTEKAKLPSAMRKIKADGWELEEWRYALATAAQRAMKKDGVEYHPQDVGAKLQAVESYMEKRSVQEEAYNSHYATAGDTPTNPRTAGRAPVGVTQAVWSGAGSMGTVGESTQPLKASTAGGLPTDASNGLSPGTPEFEQEKQRRLAYWKQKAADRLRIETTDKKAGGNNGG